MVASRKRNLPSCVTTLDMELNPQDLEKIARLTLEHYNQYAEEFWQGTRDHDVSQNMTRHP